MLAVAVLWPFLVHFLPGAFDFFGGYTHMDSGILFGIHNSCVSTYLIPGMAAWDGYPAVSTPILRRHDSITTPTSVTEGAVPVWHQFGGKVCGGPTACAAGTQLHSGRKLLTMHVGY